jgi:release factor glutamine methyltransferase
VADRARRRSGAGPGPAHFTELVDARCVGEPLAYLLGWREFHGHRFVVTPQVLIPRPETELLVDAVIATAPHNATVLDLGTGSGCIALSIAIARPDLTITATDVSAAALAVARNNAMQLCPQAVARQHLVFLHSDWWQALDPNQRFDVIVANPPYIAAGDRHLSEGDLRHEPSDALTDHGDGLSAIKAILEKASAHIKTPGWLLLEHGFDQGVAVRRLLASDGFSQVQTVRDAAGLDRITCGKYFGCADSGKKAENS